MLNTSAVSVFKTFSTEEIKRFEEFLLSPYYNKNSVIVNLFRIIRKYQPEFKSDLLDRKKIWNKLYPNKEFNYGVMKNLIYDLGKASDKFIGLQIYEKDKNLSALYLMKAQKNRNLNNAFEKSLKIFKNDLTEMKQDIEFFYYNYRALKLEREFISNLGIAKAEERINEANEIEFLTLYYLNECADIYNCFFINGSYLKKDLNNNNLDLFINYMENTDHSFKEISDCSLLNLKLILSKDNDKIYSDLKNIFRKNSHKFSSSYNSDLGLTLMEFCNRAIMKGKTEYVKEMFEITHYIFENELLMDDKKEFMNPFVFIQLISTACSLKKFDWVKQFIDNNIKKINPEFRDKFYNFAFVTLHFKMKNYSDALEYVSRMEIKSPMDHVSIKRFQMMIYYESGYTDELYSLIEAFRNFISKNRKITESVRLQAGNFVNYTKRLSDMKFNNSIDKINISRIKDELIDLEVINKNWLIEKAEEL
ncbi:MAG TPA: hypothetical protein PKD83_13765 [Ignavibacteria bacterium]|nr:hypothetical protein [Ignavibacteria bacterium]